MSAFQDGHLGKPEQSPTLGIPWGAGQESQRKERLPEVSGLGQCAEQLRLARTRNGGKKGEGCREGRRGP